MKPDIGEQIRTIKIAGHLLCINNMATLSQLASRKQEFDVDSQEIMQQFIGFLSDTHDSSKKLAVNKALKRGYATLYINPNSNIRIPVREIYYPDSCRMNYYIFKEFPYIAMNLISYDPNETVDEFKTSYPLQYEMLMKKYNNEAIFQRNVLASTVVVDKEDWVKIKERMLTLYGLSDKEVKFGHNAIDVPNACLSFCPA